MESRSLCPVAVPSESESGKPRRLESLKAFFEERLGLDSLAALAAKKTVPLHRTSIFYYFGGMALFLFAVQIVTGMLLALYYKPTPDEAFESVRLIMTEINFGWLMRSAHVWSANLLIGVLFLHLLSAYMMRAYRRPREITWISGVLLLGLFLALGFSGYLLPWNELAFFATRVGTEIVGTLPVVGRQLLLLSRSGENVTGDTLARFYALHVVILPALVLVLLSIHLYLVQKHGMSVPDHALKRFGNRDRVPSIGFVPDFLLRDMVGWFLALGLLGALAALFPWELGEKADPFGATPEGIQPEWYFLFMFQALKLLPAHILGMEGETFGVLFFGAAGAGVLFIPFIDRGQRTRAFLNTLAVAAVAVFIVMTAWGFFQSPNLRVILTASLALGVALLAFPLSEHGSLARRSLWVLMGAAGALLAVTMAALLGDFDLWGGFS